MAPAQAQSPSIRPKIVLKQCIEPALSSCVVHACLEAIRPMVVDFSDARTAWYCYTATGAGGRHGHRQNASYALVNSTVF